MSLVSRSAQLIDTDFGERVVRIAAGGLYHDSLRRPVISAIHAMSPTVMKIGRRHGASAVIDREKEAFWYAILDTIDRTATRRAVTKDFMKTAASTWARSLASSETDPARVAFKEEHGIEPPWVLVIAPGAECNLRCTGCSAAAAGPGPSLPFEELERIVSEARRLWGIKVLVFTGGEPLLYRSEGKGVLDIAERNPDLLTLIFTNGSLIDRKTARRFERLGTPTPALSVEGLRETTDARRGPGAFDDVLRAVAALEDAGALTGISLTATRRNCEEIFSDEFLDFFFREHSAMYGFIFQYMPEGRDPDPALMVTPEQRLWMLERSWEVIEEKKIVLADFWNHGTLVGGCVAAGRDRGYVYIDWDGNVLPCVFAPYSDCNIMEIHSRGGTLNDAWESPFLGALREWQTGHASGDCSCACDKDYRFVYACPVRDHYSDFRDIVLRTGARPIGASAGACLSSGQFTSRMSEYGRDFAELSRPTLDARYRRA
jgi:MoaA/NifB/PqqE/SkfB family radical SAM enzyme